MLGDKERTDFLVVWSLKETSPKPKDCIRCSVKIALVLAIGLHHQSALLMGLRRGKTICLF
jgi:hypothetical protein